LRVAYTTVQRKHNNPTKHGRAAEHAAERTYPLDAARVARERAAAASALRRAPRRVVRPATVRVHGARAGQAERAAAAERADGGGRAAEHAAKRVDRLGAARVARERPAAAACALRCAPRCVVCQRSDGKRSQGMRSRHARTFSTSCHEEDGLGPQPPCANAALVPSAALPPRRGGTESTGLENQIEAANEG
jgi:hypothetical protein